MTLPLETAPTRQGQPRRQRRRIILLALVAGALLGPPLLLEIVAALATFPAADLAAPESSFRFLDRSGHPLRDVVAPDGVRRQWVPLDAISPRLMAATVAVEDARFFRHRGIDDVGVLRALIDALRAGRLVSGASTLTMQTARLIHPHARRRSLAGKLREAIEARRIESALNKTQILTQYLNRAPYGPALVGAAAASLAYFGKAPRTLSLAEAALLAGLPKAPTALDPRRHPRSARARRAHVLDRMRALELISRRAWRRALASPLALVAAPALNRDALHATDWARTQLQRRQSHGGVFRTTLDAPLLHDVAAIVRDHLASVGTRGATQAAVVVLDNRDGAVRALVGSAGYFTSPHGAVDGALARRQPGSALKPFTYALAFERGDTPATVIPDIETHYGDAKGRLFSPRNYTGDFSGPVLLGDALGRSLNVPAIRVAQRVGVKNLLRRLHRLGFASLTRSAQTYGLGLTLGNGEVTLVELAQAYATLARSGRACRARLFAKDPIPKDPPQVFSPQVAFLISHVLSDQRLRLEAFGPANALMFDFPVAVKTGTSTNFRDNWAIGSSGHVTVAVWVGDFEGRSLDHLSGAKGAGPLFARVLHRALGAERPDAPSPPKGVVATTICALSGKRAGPHCPHRREVYVPQSALPLPPCTWHRAIALDRRNGLRAGARCSSHHRVNRVYAVLPPAYAQWQARRDTLLPPTRYSPFCPADGPAQGALAIVNPKPKEVYLVEPGYDPKTQTLELRAQASHPVAHVVWRLDGRRIARATFPYSTRWPLNRGRHVLQVSAPGQRPDRVAFEVR